MNFYDAAIAEIEKARKDLTDTIGGFQEQVRNAVQREREEIIADLVGSCNLARDQDGMHIAVNRIRARGGQKMDHSHDADVYHYGTGEGWHEEAYVIASKEKPAKIARLVQPSPMSGVEYVLFDKINELINAWNGGRE